MRKTIAVFGMVFFWFFYFYSAVMAADIDSLVVTDSGNVGIGLNEPSSKLQIFGQRNPVPLQIGHNGSGNDFTMDIAAGQGLANLVGAL